MSRILSPRRLFPLSILLLAGLLGACAGQSAPQTSPAEAFPWHGVSGQKLLALDTSQGITLERLESETLQDVGSLTYASDCNCFYAVVESTTLPALVRIEPETGEVTRITRLRLKGLRMSRVEALTWNPRDGRLYAAGGESTFASHRVFSIDPVSRSLEDYGDVEGTMQKDIDALTVAGAQILAVDGAAGSSQLYRLEMRPGRVKAHPVGKQFRGSVVDLEFDAETQRVVAVTQDGRLLTVDLEGNMLAQTGGLAKGLSAVAFVGAAETHAPDALFSDGFESGTLSLWSDHRGRHRQKMIDRR